MGNKFLFDNFVEIAGKNSFVCVPTSFCNKNIAEI